MGKQVVWGIHTRANQKAKQWGSHSESVVFRARGVIGVVLNWFRDCYGPTTGGLLCTVFILPVLFIFLNFHHYTLVVSCCTVIILNGGPTTGVTSYTVIIITLLFHVVLLSSRTHWHLDMVHLPLNYQGTTHASLTSPCSAKRPASHPGARG